MKRSDRRQSRWGDTGHEEVEGAEVVEVEGVGNIEYCESFSVDLTAGEEQSDADMGRRTVNGPSIESFPSGGTAVMSEVGVCVMAAADVGDSESGLENVDQMDA